MSFTNCDSPGTYPARAHGAVASTCLVSSCRHQNLSEATQKHLKPTQALLLRTRFIDLARTNARPILIVRIVICVGLDPSTFLFSRGGFPNPPRGNHKHISTLEFSCVHSHYAAWAVMCMVAVTQLINQFVACRLLQINTCAPQRLPFREHEYI